VALGSTTVMNWTAMEPIFAMTLSKWRYFAQLGPARMLFQSAEHALPQAGSAERSQEGCTSIGYSKSGGQEQQKPALLGPLPFGYPFWP